MNKQEKIQLIETKITEIKNLLNNWIKDIQTYHNYLENLTNQLNQIKTKSLNKNTKENMNQINKKVPETINNIK